MVAWTWHVTEHVIDGDTSCFLDCWRGKWADRHTKNIQSLHRVVSLHMCVWTHNEIWEQVNLDVCATHRVVRCHSEEYPRTKLYIAKAIHSSSLRKWCVLNVNTAFLNSIQMDAYLAQHWDMMTLQQREGSRTIHGSEYWFITCTCLLLHVFFYLDVHNTEITYFGQ